MPRSAKDIQLLELKDTISKLNGLISAQTGSINSLQKTVGDLRQELCNKQPETIDPETIEVSAHKRERKPNPTYEEMFENLPGRQVLLDTLTDEDKTCPVCGTQMVPIETEIVRTELVYHPAVLERIEYIATTYGCPALLQTGEGF